MKTPNVFRVIAALLTLATPAALHQIATAQQPVCPYKIPYSVICPMAFQTCTNSGGKSCPGSGSNYNSGPWDCQLDPAKPPGRTQCVGGNYYVRICYTWYLTCWYDDFWGVCVPNQNLTGDDYSKPVNATIPCPA